MLWMLFRKLKALEAESAAGHNRPDFAAETHQNLALEEFEDRLKQKVLLSAANLSLPPGLAKTLPLDLIGRWDWVWVYG